MSTELPKTYDPAAVEATAYQTWLKEGAFHADPAKPGPAYTIVIPPPNVTGALHLGHAIQDTLQDILIRNHRMRGFNTLWMPGIDHAGIATQAVVEKQLKEKENKTRHDVGREGLVERIWAWKQQYGDRILEQMKRIGCSCDWDRTRFTLDEMCARAVREFFFKLFKDGLIYRGKRLVNWDVFLQTSISDDEIYHETVKTNLWHIKYPIEGTSQFMVVATTRPETMLGDTAVAVHSEDGRWNEFIGQKVRLPLTNRLIPIIADDILVDPKFGSGVVKVTPAHDPNDYAVWQRHQGKPDQIDILNILTPDGKINENGGSYVGMKRDAARKKVVDDLAGLGLLAKEEPYETQVGHSDRSKTPVEPYLSDQWFVKMAPLAEPALEAVRSGRVKFTPERYAQTYLSWLGEKRDWPISRQLWWGHRIPVWRLTKPLNGSPEALLELVNNQAVASAHYGESEITAFRTDATGFGKLSNLISSPQLDSFFNLSLSVECGHPEIERELEQMGFEQDPDVLDTWFSSALWPHSTLGWPDQTPELKRYYPTTVLLTAREIITLWVARMVMAGLYNMGDVPFHGVYIHPTILDGKGERMSKSKDNGVDPVDIVETYGADALRFTLTSMATETQDVRMPVKKLPNGRNTSDKFDIGRNFCNKLWNAARFAISNLEEAGAKGPSKADPLAPVPGGEGRGEGPNVKIGQHRLSSSGPSPQPSPLNTGARESEYSLADRWILSRLAKAITDIDAALAGYHFDVYSKLCYDFFWRDFCDWYVEAIKPAMKDPARAATTAIVLAAALDASLRLMHPMIPFITETIWWKLNDVHPERAIHGKYIAPSSPQLVTAPWPKAGPALTDESAERDFATLQEVIGAIRNLRNEYKVEQKKLVSVSVLAPKPAAILLRGNRELVELLGTCRLTDARADLPPPANAARVLAAGCEVFVEGLVDPAAEKERLAKTCQELSKQIAALRGRLANAAYIAKAPPSLVQQTKDQLAQAEAEFTKLGGTP